MFEIVPHDHRLRPVVESAIRSAFQRDHGARLDRLPACLVASTDEAGVICAASLRFAEDGFFSERYLDQPIEQLIARRTGARADRAALVEVGSLAADRPGEVKDLVGGIIRFLHHRGTRWAFFTATARLRTFLGRAGIPLVELARADPSRIDGVEAWGAYYQQDPRVMLVSDAMLDASVLIAVHPMERVCHRSAA